jgi:hypothetical protein
VNALNFILISSKMSDDEFVSLSKAKRRKLLDSFIQREALHSSSDESADSDPEERPSDDEFIDTSEVLSSKPLFDDSADIDETNEWVKTFSESSKRHSQQVSEFKKTFLSLAPRRQLLTAWYSVLLNSDDVASSCSSHRSLVAVSEFGEGREILLGLYVADVLRCLSGEAQSAFSLASTFFNADWIIPLSLLDFDLAFKDLCDAIAAKNKSPPRLPPVSAFNRHRQATLSEIVRQHSVISATPEKVNQNHLALTIFSSCDVVRFVCQFFLFLNLFVS